MNSRIEEQVVKMKFDNSGFEKSCQSTIKDLNNLQSSVDSLNGGRGLEELGRAAGRVDLSMLSRSADAVRVSFSAMQIVGMTAISELTKVALNFGRRLYANTIGQIKTGGMARAMNIEAAKFQLEGLKVAWDDISEDINYGVKDTAYGLDQAAKVASQLVASNVAIGDSMKQALRGISGVAAMTNSSYDDIGHIFTTIAGQGKVMSQNLDSLAVRGLNARAVIAESLGTTEAAVREMTSQGKLDFATFAKAMDDAFGEHAKDANKTFTGSLSNMKAALSRIGAEFATPYMDNMRDIFNSITPVINNIKSAMGPLFSDVSKLMEFIKNNVVGFMEAINNTESFSNIVDTVRYSLASLVMIIITIRDAIREVFPQFNGITSLMKSFAEHLIPTEQSLNGLKEIVKIVAVGFKVFFDVVAVGIKVFATVILIISNIVSYILTLAGGLKEILNPYITWIRENNVLEKSLSIIVGVISVVVDKVFTLINAIREFGKGTSNISANFNPIIKLLLTFTGYVVDLVTHIGIGNIAIAGLVVGIGYLISILVLFGKNITRPFASLYRTINGIGDAIKGVFSSFSGVLNSVKNLINVTSFDVITTAMMKAAVSIGVLAIAMKLLSTVDPKDLIKTGAALAYLSGILVGTLVLVNKLGPNGLKNSAALAAQLISFGVAIGALAVATALLSLIDFKKLQGAILGVTELAAIIAIMEIITKKIKTTGIGDKGLKNFTTSIFWLALSVRTLSNVDFTKMQGAILGIAELAGIVAIMEVITKALETKGMGTKGFKTFAKTILILAVAVKLLSTINFDNLEEAIAGILQLAGIIAVMEVISTVFETNGISSKGFKTFAKTILLLSVATKLLSSISFGKLQVAYIGLSELLALFIVMEEVSTIFDKGIITSGFENFAGSVAILSLTVKLLTTIPFGKLQIAYIGLSELLVLFIVMEEISTIFDKGIITSGFKSFVGSMALLSLVVKLLTTIDFGKLQIAYIGLLELLTIFILMEEASTIFDKGIISSGFEKFTYSIAILAVATKLLSTIEFGALQGAILGILELMVIVALMDLISNKITKGVGIWSRGFDMFSASVLILSSAAKILSTIPDTKKMLLTAVAISGMVLALAGAIKIMGNINIKEASGMFAMATAILAISAAMVIMKDLDPTKMVLQAATLVIMMTLLAVVMRLVEDTSVLGIVAIGVMAASIVVLAAAMKILETVDTTKINEVLKSLGIMVGVFTVLAAITAIPVLGPAFATGLLLVAGAFTIFGLAVLAAGEGINLAGQGFKAFSDAIMQLANTSEEDVNRIIAAMKQFVIGLGQVALEVVNQAPYFALAMNAIVIAVMSALATGFMLFKARMILGIATLLVILAACLPDILDALGAIIEVIAEWFDAHHEDFYRWGYSIGSGIMSGIKGAIVGLWDETFGGFFAALGELPGVVADDFAAKVNSALISQSVTDSIWNWVDLYKSGEIAAQDMIDGLNNGIAQGAYDYEEVMRVLGYAGIESFRDSIDSHSPSEEYKDISLDSIKGLIEGVLSGETSFTNIMQTLAEKGVTAFTSIFNTTGLFSGVGDIWGGGSGEVKTALDRIEDMSEHGAYAQSHGHAHSYVYRWQAEGFESAEDWEKANDPLSYFYKMISSEKDATDAEDAMSKATQDLTANLGDLTSGTGSATKETDKLAESIESALDIFSEFNTSASLTGTDVLANFLTQIQGVTQWSEELASLSGRGISQTLLDELAELGPSGYERIHAFYTMTDAELSLFNKMYAMKLSLQKNTANDIRNSFKTGSKQITKVAESTGEAIVQKIGGGIAASDEAISESLDDVITKATSDLVDEGYYAGADWAQSVAEGVKSVSSFMTDTWASMGYESVEAFRNLMTYQYALYSIDDFQDGIKDAVTSTMSIFDEVKEEEEISSEQMIKNMEGQIKRIGKWATNLKKLAGRGMSDELLAELESLGPEGAAKVQAFVDMTDEQLAKANRLYSSSLDMPDYTANRITQSFAAAGRSAVLGFSEEIDPDIANDIMEKLAYTSLDSLKEALAEIGDQPSLETMTAGALAVEGLAEGVMSNLDVATAAGTVAGNAVTTAMKEAASEVYDEIDNIDSAATQGSVRIQPVSERTRAQRLTTMESRLDPGVSTRQAANTGEVQRINSAYDYFRAFGKDMTTELQKTNQTMQEVQSTMQDIRENTKNLKNSGDVYIDGNTVVGYVDRNLGNRVSNNQRTIMTHGGGGARVDSYGGAGSRG